MKEEFEKQQRSSPLAGLTGGNSASSFDMAAWMAGSSKKAEKPVDGNVGSEPRKVKSSGAEQGGGKARRRG